MYAILVAWWEHGRGLAGSSSYRLSENLYRLILSIRGNVMVPFLYLLLKFRTECLVHETGNPDHQLPHALVVVISHSVAHKDVETSVALKSSKDLVVFALAKSEWYPSPLSNTLSFARIDITKVFEEVLLISWGSTGLSGLVKLEVGVTLQGVPQKPFKDGLTNYFLAQILVVQS